MEEGLFVHHSCAHTLLGTRFDGTWLALRAAADNAEGAIGNIYRGRVVRVVAGMQAAFVDIGLRRTAFLHLDDALPQDGLPKTGKSRPALDKVLHPGQTILVQVRKEPLADKGARVTCHISLSGRFVVLLPKAKHVATSQRIEPGPELDALRALLESYSGGFGGIIGRTAAKGAAPAAIEAELQELRATWQHLLDLFAAGKKPGLLSVQQGPAVERCLTLLESLTRRAAGSGQGAAAATAEADPSQAAATKTTGSAGASPASADAAGSPQAPRTLLGNDAQLMQLVADALQERGTPAHVLAGPDVHRGKKQADKLRFFASVTQALGRTVKLASGGSLAIDECEAMTVVDVNSGKFVGKDNLAATMLALNLEAAHETARQLELRGIGGIVVIDFVDMKDAAHRSQVALALRQALAAFPSKSYVSQMSELGLVQLTRRRTQPSLLHSLSEACAHCQGRGRVRAPWAVAAAALDAAGHALEHEPAEQLLLNVAPSVADILEGAAKGQLRELELRYACAIVPVARHHFAVEAFEVLHGARLGSVQAHDLRF